MKEKTTENVKTGLTGLEIAVIGMAARFPAAKNIHEFWHNLIDGVEPLSYISEEESKEVGAAPDLMENPDFVRTRGGLLEGRDCFDAAFFDYTTKEAEVMDPQTRVFHECAWQALEDAGYISGSHEESIGLFAGGSSSFFWEGLSLLSGKAEQLGGFAASHLIDKDFLTTRVAYKLDLQGPCYAVQTACSTSLVAVHLGCRALLTGECKMALAGGVTISHQEQTGYVFQEGMVHSPDGHCRAFDARAKGFAVGEGAGAVVLKRLKEAIADRDHIYAVVKGSAVNNDGIRKVGYTAPSIKGQFEVIRAAMRFARVEPESISYVETHGTATPLGDPVEVEALIKAFNTKKKAICGLGAVKTNVGHTGAAAGIAGFIKAVLALKHKKIPPSLHYENPNPKIDFLNSPFYVNTTPREWENNGGPLRAGVSSFGIGGTNAHVILEEFSEGTGGLAPLPDAYPPREHRLILLSANTSTALDKMTENFVQYLQQTPEVNLDNVAYSLQVGRRSLKYRQKLICSDVKEAIHELSTPGSRKVQRFYVKPKSKKVVFMFPGIGAQYVNMGLELYQEEQYFRREMDRCFNILEPLLDYHIKEILYPTHPAPSGHPSQEGSRDGSPYPPKDGSDHIHQFEVAQLVTFIFEYALAKLLRQWGLTPDAMIGYSFGEYISACISGVLSLEDALALVVYRGELLRQIPPGAMTSVPLYEKDIKPFLDDELSIAIDIGPSCIVSGPEPAIARLENRLKEQKIIGIRVKTSKALHSQMMHPVAKAFEDRVGQLTLNRPDIPYISNVTGRWITVNDATDPLYWSNHLKNTVRFHDGMKELVKEENCLFVEVGPSRDLCTMIERYIDDSSKQQAINLVRPRQSNIPDVYYLLSRLGNLWLYGANIDWSGFYSPGKYYRIPLPGYPFEGQRYWISPEVLRGKFGELDRGTEIRKNPDISQWFYVPVWRRSLLPSPGNGSSDVTGDIQEQPNWLVFEDEYGFGGRFARRLKNKGAEVTVVKKGSAFERVSHREYTINPQAGSDYLALFKELGQMNRLPHEIAHCWGVSEVSALNPADPSHREEKESLEEQLAAFQEMGFSSLLFLAKAIASQDVLHDINIGIITTNVQDVTGQEVLCPEKAMVLGPGKVIPQEYPYIICKSIDIDLPDSGSWKEEKLIDQLQDEFKAKSLDTVIAFRNNYRWVQVFEPAQWSQPGEKIPRLREGGVYLITGGMGNIGFLLAENLVKRVKARLILTGRTALPPREEWDSWLETHKEDDLISHKIRKIRHLEQLGGEVLACSADTANLERMQEVVCQAEQRFGPINGLIHAAGDLGKTLHQPIKNVDENVVNQQFKPKIYGLYALETLFQDKELDFGLLTSSLSPVLGGLGFAAYSAGNCFMDAYAFRYNRTRPQSWISVNWGDWCFTEEMKSNVAFGSAGDELLMSPEEGEQTFERIIYHCKDSQVAVSAGDLGARIDKWVKLRSIRDESPKKKEETAIYQPRPDLENTYVKPSNKLEQTITEVLQEFLGIDRVGIDDNFFEIGATSLNLIQINRNLRIKVGKDISIVTWFEYPTVALFAKYLETREPGITVKSEDVGDIDRSTVITQGKNKLKRLRRLGNEN